MKMFRLPCRAIRKGSSRGRPRASRIARCRQGGAIRRRNPPPPAPRSLPPVAPLRRAASYHSSICWKLIPKPSDRFSSQPSWSRLGEGVEVAVAGERLAHLVGQVAHLPEHGHPVGGPVRLLLEDLVGVAGLAGVEQERPPLQLVEGLGLARDRLDVHRVVGVEPDVVQAAEDRRVLVLAADRLLEDVDLDPAGLLGQVLAADDLAPVGVQGVEQAGGQAAAGAHARSRPGRRRWS